MHARLLAVLVGALLCGLPVQAATPDHLRCQARIDSSKRVLEVTHKGYLAWRQHRDEPHRCAFLAQARTQFRMVKEMFRACVRFHPDARSEMDRMDAVIQRIDRKGGCPPSRTRTRPVRPFGNWAAADWGAGPSA